MDQTLVQEDDESEKNAISTRGFGETNRPTREQDSPDLKVISPFQFSTRGTSNLYQKMDWGFSTLLWGSPFSANNGIVTSAWAQTIANATQTTRRYFIMGFEDCELHAPKWHADRFGAAMERGFGDRSILFSLSFTFQQRKLTTAGMENKSHAPLQQCEKNPGFDQVAVKNTSYMGYCISCLNVMYLGKTRRTHENKLKNSGKKTLSELAYDLAYSVVTCWHWRWLKTESFLSQHDKNHSKLCQKNIVGARSDSAKIEGLRSPAKRHLGHLLERKWTFSDQCLKVEEKKNALAQKFTHTPHLRPRIKNRHW
jgi:hypothetical protein